VTGLALDGVDSGGAAYGAFASGPTTSVEVDGTAEQVVTILRHVWGGLAEPRAGRFEDVRERELLHSGWRRHDEVDQFLAMRFGPRGPGLAGQPELGLHHLDADAVARRRETYFVPQNAALALKNVRPDDLRLPPLPQGTWRAPPALAPTPLPLPAWSDDGGDDVAVASIAEGSAAADAFTAVAVRRLRAALKDDPAHPVGLSTVRLWPGRDHVVIHCGAGGGKGEHVRDALLAILEGLAEAGPEEREIAERHRHLRAWKADPESVFARIEWAPHRHVLDPEGAHLDALDDAEPPSPDAASAAGRDFLATALYRLPRHTGMPLSFHCRERSSPDVLTGTTYARAAGEARSGTLVVAPEGITMTIDDRRVTIRFDRCEAMTRWPDGTRQLYGSDGFGAQFRPREWVDGESAGAAIDDALRHVTVEMRPPSSSRTSPG
jgi:hypothetical protein